VRAPALAGRARKRRRCRRASRQGRRHPARLARAGGSLDAAWVQRDLVWFGCGRLPVGPEVCRRCGPRACGNSKLGTMKLAALDTAIYTILKSKNLSSRSPLRSNTETEFF